MTVKQVIVVRKDLNMRRGKSEAQVAHAAMKWLVDRVKEHDRDTDHDKGSVGLTVAEDQWMNGSFTKIVVSVNSEAELDAIYNEALSRNLEVHMITDAGKTEFGGIPTKTCLAIGPDEAMYIDPITKDLVLR